MISEMGSGVWVAIAAVLIGLFMVLRAAWKKPPKKDDERGESPKDW